MTIVTAKAQAKSEANAAKKAEQKTEKSKAVKLAGTQQKIKKQAATDTQKPAADHAAPAKEDMPVKRCTVSLSGARAVLVSAALFFAVAMALRSNSSMSTDAAEIVPTKSVSNWADASNNQQCDTAVQEAFETTCPAGEAKGFAYSAPLDPTATKRAGQHVEKKEGVASSDPSAQFLTTRKSDQGTAVPPQWSPLFLAASTTPLSACVIIPSNGRPELLRHTLERVHAQEYDGLKRVVVIDDSSPELQMVPADFERRFASRAVQLEYIAMNTQHTVGQKRNIAVEQCEEDVVVHWDDDDFYADTRLREQLAPLAEGEADLTVFKHQLTYFMKEGALVAAGGAGAVGADAGSWGPHFGTLAWRRSVAPKGLRYSDASQGEDIGLAQRLVEAGGRLLQVSSLSRVADAPPVFVCVRHGSNTWNWEASPQTGQFQLNSHEIDASILHPADRAFAERLREDGVLEMLSVRRATAPAIRAILDPSVDPNFFVRDHHSNICPPSLRRYIANPDFAPRSVRMRSMPRPLPPVAAPGAVSRGMHQRSRPVDVN